MIYGMGGGRHLPGVRNLDEFQWREGKKFWTPRGGGKIVRRVAKGGLYCFLSLVRRLPGFFQSLVGGLDLFLPWSGGVELNFRPRPGKIFHYPGRNLDWDFFKKKMLSRIYILKMNFHITDLFNLFHHIKMYFVFIMQSNFDSLNVGIFYAYFLFAYLFELIDKEELYA